MLEALANAFTIGVMLWTLGLILGKLITVLLPSAAASKDDVEEAVEEVREVKRHEKRPKASEALLPTRNSIETPKKLLDPS